MILSKTEMEDIWHNKPVGYLKTEKARLKKYKKYICSVQPYKYDYGVHEEFVVLAVSKYDAELRATDEYKKKHNIEGYINSPYYGWKRTVRETK